SDTIDMLERSLETIGYPHRHFFSSFQECLYAKANERNVTMLFSGFGGDDCVSESIDELYLHLLLKKGRLLEFGKIWVRKGCTPMHSFFRTGKRFMYSLLKTDEKEQYKRQEALWEQCIFHDQFIKDQNFKKTFFKKAYSVYNDSLKDSILYNLCSSWVNERIETGTITAARYGIQYAYPLLDKPLVEFYYSLPDWIKAGKKYSRWLIRQVLKEELPETIANQRKDDYGASVPFYKVGMEKDFYKLKDYCKSLPSGHDVFDYVDKQKIERFQLDDKDAEEQFSLMALVVMMSMFFNQRRNMILYDL
ncbi:MAG TPA: asparagine synthase-related protein, partial [Flavisolibacter sp.]|nr:asparagine synthase-related protein [Flavisolibacter sp.]